MTEHIRDGFDAALTALGYLIGALLPIAFAALIIYGGYVLADNARHQLTVRRIRRQTRAGGRADDTLRRLQQAEAKGRARVTRTRT